MSEYVGRRSERVWSPLNAIDVQRGQKRAYLDRQDCIWRKNVLEGDAEVIWGEILGRVDELLQKRLEGVRTVGL